MREADLDCPGVSQREPEGLDRCPRLDEDHASEQVSPGPCLGDFVGPVGECRCRLFDFFFPAAGDLVQDHHIGIAGSDEIDHLVESTVRRQDVEGEDSKMTGLGAARPKKSGATKARFTTAKSPIATAVFFHRAIAATTAMRIKPMAS